LSANIVNKVGAVAKNGSFGFACVSACAVRAKPNVPFCAAG